MGLILRDVVKIFWSDKGIGDVIKADTVPCPYWVHAMGHTYIDTLAHEGLNVVAAINSRLFVYYCSLYTITCIHPIPPDLFHLIHLYMRLTTPFLYIPCIPTSIRNALTSAAIRQLPA
ncbi:hypothetical protein KC342_g117 [Hortaea werneckii]|nr:hypothetical protein KC342_g117 [Hortaea werneckii]